MPPEMRECCWRGLKIYLLIFRLNPSAGGCVAELTNTILFLFELAWAVRDTVHLLMFVYSSVLLPICFAMSGNKGVDWLNPWPSPIWVMLIDFNLPSSSSIVPFTATDFYGNLLIDRLNNAHEETCDIITQWFRGW